MRVVLSYRCGGRLAVDWLSSAVMRTHVVQSPFNDQIKSRWRDCILLAHLCSILSGKRLCGMFLPACDLAGCMSSEWRPLEMRLQLAALHHVVKISSPLHASSRHLKGKRRLSLQSIPNTAGFRPAAAVGVDCMTMLGPCDNQYRSTTAKTVDSPAQ